MANLLRADPRRTEHQDSLQPAAPVRPGLGATRRIIQIEFNELCPHLLDRWMGEGKLPNFKRFYDASQAFVSEADAGPGPYLEPWVQWYSMHTGLHYQQHHVAHLTDGPRAGHRDIWQALIAEGRRVGCCSSMNVKGFDAPGSYFLPDPWCTSERASPAVLDIFARVVSHYVQEYTNPAFALGMTEYLRFAGFMLGHGLRPSTVRALGAQMIADKLDRRRYWRRAPLLDRLQFDLFRHYQRTARPDFSTFFCNSTAHYQHAYWRHMDPAPFRVQPSDEDRRTYGDAVLFGYQQMDRMVSDFLALEDDDVMLILSTALSQQPFVRGEAEGGHTFYRVRDIAAFLAELGVACERVEPVMTHQYIARFPDQAGADAARDRLASVRYDGKQIFGFSESEPGTLYFGNWLHGPVPQTAEVVLAGASNRARPYYDVFYHINETKSGMHHPDGVLWFKTGTHRRHADKVSILDVMPTLLEFYGIPLRPEDRRAFQGRSLMPELRA